MSVRVTPNRSPRKSHRQLARPPFECIALLLQGGGALGAYQAGVYEALSEAHLAPDWVAGISIGAVNAALIAGNAPSARVEKLREIWNHMTAGGPWDGIAQFAMAPSMARSEFTRGLLNQLSAGTALLGGAAGFFAPRVPSAWLQPPGSIEATSYYDTAPLKATLERLVDFERINAGETRFSVGAVNVTTGNFLYFDNTTHTIGAEHVMASGALPPGFPPVEIEGEFYWDGGLVSNTPLQWVLESEPRRDTLAFQVDLWSARGTLPRTMLEVMTRQKEIQYSSRTRNNSDRFKNIQKIRNALASLAAEAPGRAPRQPGIKAIEIAHATEGLQPRAAHLSHQAVRRRLQGLRILAPQHGGSLARGVSRYGPHPAPFRGARASRQPRGRHDLRFGAERA